MKKIILAIAVLCSQTSFAEGLLLKADLDPREVNLPQGYKLWSEIQADNIKNRPMREDLMNSSSLYLENRISHSDFLILLNNWSETGFNQQERVVLTDTLAKSSMPVLQKSQWLCRVDSERNCPKIKIFPKHLSPLLQKYDWLAIDGQVYPRMSWDEILIPNDNMTWVFLSARFETYTFKGKWDDLKYKNPNLHDWISGTCEDYNVLYSVQDMNNQVLVNRNCLRTSLVKPKKNPSFYDQNKKAIWMAAGLVIGVGTYKTVTGKNIVIEKPSFR